MYNMKKLFGLMAILSAVCLFAGCGKTGTVREKEVQLSDETLNSIEELHSIAVNYSNGTAPLMMIPVVEVENIYNDWDAIVALSPENAPISLREYVDPSIVYLDYDCDYSIVWDKENNDVRVEPTIIDAREDYKQKEHK